jgi:uncharacterized membrane protein
MTILLQEPFPIPLHAIAAMIAIILGGAQLALPKGTLTHKILGRAWVGLMLIISVTSFFIHEIKLWGQYSPIHLLSIFTLVTLGVAVNYARIGRVRDHQRIMVMLYGLALILTGLFTLYPGRVMHQVVFC